MDPHALQAACPEPTSLITGELIKQGLLGVAIIILLFVVGFLFKRNEKQAERHQLALEAKEKENAAEVARLQEQVEALVQRHLGKAETWVEKGHELGARLNNFLEIIVKESQARREDYERSRRDSEGLNRPRR